MTPKRLWTDFVHLVDRILTLTVDESGQNRVGDRIMTVVFEQRGGNLFGESASDKLNKLI
jgi:hypothetical protein